MTLYEFIVLSQDERAERVWEEGTFLAENPERGLLYFMGEFYAEVLYDAEENQISEVKCFKTTCNLDPYLAYIDIDSTIKR